MTGRTYDTNWIFNAVYQNSGSSFDTRIDTNQILNTVYDSTNNALKVNVSNLPSGTTDTICTTNPGTNITTAGTLTFQTVSVVDSPSVDNITVSGTCEADVYTSGGTNLYSIFLTAVDGNDITRVSDGTNTTTGGTVNIPTVNLVDSPSVNNLTASGTVESATFTSGGTDLSLLFLTTYSDLNDITRVSDGTNTTTGGTVNIPTVNLVDSPSINNLTASGTVESDQFTSGGTNLNEVFAPISIVDTTDITRVGQGSNITTGGTANIPTINLVSTPSVDGLTASGTVESATFTSGGTDLSLLFAIPGDIVDYSSQLATKADLSGATFTQITVPVADSNLSGAGFTSIGVAVSDETTQIVSAATAALTYYAPYAMTVTDVTACLSTSGSTDSWFDIHKEGVSILSTIITIDDYDTSTASVPPVVGTSAIENGAKIEFFIDKAGTDAAGAKIFINGYKS